MDSVQFPRFVGISALESQSDLLQDAGHDSEILNLVRPWPWPMPFVGGKPVRP
jgi:hypothetical protein